jgi:hypothetical protein
VSKLVDHLESCLGTVLHEWSELPDLLGTGVQINQHDSAPRGVALTLATLGLSRYPLRSVSSGETIYHELLLFASRPAEPFNLPAVLAQIAHLTITRKRAILKGDILGSGGPLLNNSRMEGFFAALPLPLPPDLASVQDDDGRGIALVWLVPITAAEATWARTHGWQAFEKELDRQCADRLDWYRGEMVLT